MKLRGLLTLLLGLFLLGCTHDSDIDGAGANSDGTTNVNIKATLPEFGGATRGVDSSKGGVANIDWTKYELRIIVKAYGTGDYAGKVATEAVDYKVAEKDASGNYLPISIDLDLPLTIGHSYDIYLWADYVLQSEPTNDLHYNIDKFPAITLKGDNQLVINDETRDAFFGRNRVYIKSTGIVWDKPMNTMIERAVTKLRLVATDAAGASATSAKLQVGKLYTGFNIATGELTAATLTPITSIKTAFEIYSTETPAEGDTEYSMSFITAYMLWPASESVAIVGSFYEDGKDDPVSEVAPTSDIALKRGNLTTLRGEMFDTGWDGSVETPTEIADDWLVINTPGELLWLATAAEAPTLNGTTYSKFRLGKDIDVYDSTAIQSLKVGDNATFDGNGKTISGFGATTTALFGSAQGLNAYNFTLEGYNVTHNGHIGVLVNELSQSATFTDITIKNSSATTTNGAAGGVVGYIAGGEDKNLEVTFTNCHLVGVKATGSLAEGKFVGLMHGYDNEEILSFDADCSATDCSVVDYVSPYAEDNDAQWLDEGETAFDFTTYNGWLGDEEMYRATVKFADHRMQIKWDGITTVEPMLANETYDSDVSADNNKFVVYSPFDLAGVRKKTASPSAIFLRSDIDMNGQGVDGKYNVPSNFTQSAYSSADDNHFDPFNYVTTLDGYKDASNNYSIWNLSISQIEQERAAFILYASSTTVHKNINFRNCCTVSVHKQVETDAKAYGAIVVSNVDATYTMENVHAYDCKVFALQKVGTLGARISGTSTLKNCTVNNCYVENYECIINERFSSGTINKEIKVPLLGTAKVTEVWCEFYPHGEVGGMFGFIQGTSTLTNCKVYNTNVYAFGQDGKDANIEGNTLAKIGIAFLGYYKVPGRHVSTMIGDIRATGTIKLNGCTVDSVSKCLNDWDKHNSKCEYIGEAYIVKFSDSEGTLTVDNSNVNVYDCKK